MVHVRLNLVQEELCCVLNHLQFKDRVFLAFVDFQLFDQRACKLHHTPDGSEHFVRKGPRHYGDRLVLRIKLRVLIDLADVAEGNHLAALAVKAQLSDNDLEVEWLGLAIFIGSFALHDILLASPKQIRNR